MNIFIFLSLWLFSFNDFRLNTFQVQVVLYIHLCSKAHCVISQTESEGGMDKERGRKRGGRSLETSNSATVRVALTPCSIRTGCLTRCDCWPQLCGLAVCMGGREGRFGGEVGWVGGGEVVWGIKVKERSCWTLLVASALREPNVDPQERRR